MAELEPAWVLVAFPSKVNQSRDRALWVVGGTSKCPTTLEQLSRAPFTDQKDLL